MSVTKVSIMFNLHSPARLSTPTTDKAPHLMEVPSNSFNVDTPIGRSCMNVLRYAQNCTDLQSLPISGEVRVWINNCVCVYVCVCVHVYVHVYMYLCIYVHPCVLYTYRCVYMLTCMHMFFVFSMLLQSVIVLKHYYKFHYCCQNISLTDTSRHPLR